MNEKGRHRGSIREKIKYNKLRAGQKFGTSSNYYKLDLLFMVS